MTAPTRTRREVRRGHGWGAYWLPYLSFLVLVEIGGRADAAYAGLFLVLKVLVPGALFARYALRGSFPELRGFQPTPALLLDVGVGLAGAALWIAPFLLFDSLRPEDAEGFDTTVFGAGLTSLAIGLRFVGYACVTPFVEELFVRSWLLRFIDVFDERQDFRDVPIARFTWRSFLVVMGYFVLSHVPWEWAVMFVWSLGTMLWFYHRQHIVPLVIVHAVTNGAILVFVALFDERFTDSQGVPSGLWFFV